MEKLWFLLCCFNITLFNAHTRCGRGSIFCHLLVVAWFLAFYHVVHPGLCGLLVSCTTVCCLFHLCFPLGCTVSAFVWNDFQTFLPMG